MRYRVKIRRTIGAVRPEAEQLDGKVFDFYDRPGWVIEGSDHPLYAGEQAMLPRDDNWPDDAPNWIASGDLEPVPEVTT